MSIRILERLIVVLVWGLLGLVVTGVLSQMTSPPEWVGAFGLTALAVCIMDILAMSFWVPLTDGGRR